MRVTSFDAEPEPLRRAMGFIGEQVVAVSRQTPGWKGVLSFVSYDGRRGMTLNFWDSYETLIASGHNANAFHGAASATGMNVVTGVERLEVILDERPE